MINRSYSSWVISWAFSVMTGLNAAVMQRLHWLSLRNGQVKKSGEFRLGESGVRSTSALLLLKCSSNISWSDAMITVWVGAASCRNYCSFSGRYSSSLSSPYLTGCWFVSTILKQPLYINHEFQSENSFQARLYSVFFFLISRYYQILRKAYCHSCWGLDCPLKSKIKTVFFFKIY